MNDDAKSNIGVVLVVFALGACGPVVGHVTAGGESTGGPTTGAGVSTSDDITGGSGGASTGSASSGGLCVEGEYRPCENGLVSQCYEGQWGDCYPPEGCACDFDADCSHKSEVCSWTCDCVCDLDPACAGVCGNGVVDGPEEECDDGNLDGNDTCAPGCRLPDGPRKMLLTTGWVYTCAVLETGDLHCWGANNVGTLGLGHTMDVSGLLVSEVEPVELGAEVVALAGGDAHTCAVVAGGKVRCWGWGLEGQLGYANADTIGDDEKASAAGAVDIGGTAIQIAVGFRHNCALLIGGKVRCWGRNELGVLGYGHLETIGDDEVPASAGDLKIAGVVTQITSGMFHNCVLMADKTVRCWGHNDGRLGYGHNDPIIDAAQAGPIDLGVEVVAIATGSHHNCALTADGALRCWGMNANGQLGYGHTDSIGDDEHPSAAGDVPLGGARVLDVALGLSYTCALVEPGAVRCWGRNDSGQLGLGNTVTIGDDELPTAVPPVDIGEPIVDLSAHGYHTCGLSSEGTLRCWGMGEYGQLGYGSVANVGDDEAPAVVGPVPLP